MVQRIHSCLETDDDVTVRAVSGDSEPLTQTILRGVAALENVPVTEIGPLYDQIETEALAALLSHADDAGSAVSVEFTVDGNTVVVSDGGCVCVEPTASEDGARSMNESR